MSCTSSALSDVGAVAAVKASCPGFAGLAGPAELPGPVDVTGPPCGPAR
jgi:hypothetical protein